MKTILLFLLLGLSCSAQDSYISVDLGKDVMVIPQAADKLELLVKKYPHSRYCAVVFCGHRMEGRIRSQMKLVADTKLEKLTLLTSIQQSFNPPREEWRHWMKIPNRDYSEIVESDVKSSSSWTAGKMSIGAYELGVYAFPGL